MSAPRKVGVIGLGLIGGSICKAIKQRWPDTVVVGYARSEEVRTAALAAGAVDTAADTLSDVCLDAEFVFIATPVGVIPQIIENIAPYVRPDTVVTDVGSTKAGIVADAEKALAGRASFIGGHPMAGSEQTGIASADASLLANAVYVLTPTANTSPAAYQKLHWLLTQLGARVMALSPERHDEVVAAVSHVPHLLAAGLVNVVARLEGEAESVLAFAAGGFRDMTRIAVSNPELWVDICLDNREAIIETLGRYVSEVEGVRRFLEEADAAALAAQFEAARDLRSRLSLVQPAAALAEIDIPVSDRPGTLSEITLAFGRAGINIEDIQILHLAADRGVIKLLVSDHSRLETVISELRAGGFAVTMRGQEQSGVGTQGQ